MRLRGPRSARWNLCRWLLWFHPEFWDLFCGDVDGVGRRGVRRRMGVRRVGLPQQEEPDEPLGELPFIGPGDCPWILDRMAWLGQDPLAVHQFRLAGAQIPQPGGTTFWLDPKGRIYQFRRRPDGAVDARSCPLSGTPAEREKMLRRLQRMTTTELEAAGLQV